MRTYYLAFGYTDRWYDKWLKGYTHVAVIARVNGALVGIEPINKHCFLYAGNEIILSNWNEVLKVEVRSSKANQLIGLKFQTCATLVQYIMGIKTGAYLCQTLYDRLTARTYPGVEVSKCDSKILN